ncbi:MAG: outer membrane beta-barrel protein [Bacteroidota bacterium]
MRNLLYSLFILFSLTVYSANAQQINPTHIGSVKGILRDTAHNYTLKSATVSLFKGDSTLLNYQLSNNYGEFTFKNLPLNAKMYVEVSHVAYQLFRQEFTLINGKPTLDLKTLILQSRNISLKEVEIKIPPISMNGDTLEFNAAAFKLDSNAVVEDLLRKIPNVTLWGDGQITVNGREVKSLLVNGKEFFGGDFKMATQNIAKNALDKVQVYSTRDESNPLDSTLTVNLKLKKGKDIGYFGKIGAGYGTSEKYEIDGNINMFTPKMQLGIIGASNNINKVATNIRTLTANSTFKGIGTNAEYQSDFRQTGINQSNVSGATFTYNFIEKPDWQKKSTLNANYFIQNRNSENLNDTETITSLNANNRITDQNTNKTNSISTDQKFDSRFEFVKRNQRLNITQSIFSNNGTSNNETKRNALNDQNLLTSTNNTSGKNDYINKGFTLSANYGLSPNYITRRKHRFNGINANYSVSINDNQSNRSNLTSFRSFTNPALNRDFDRRYDTESSSINQTFSVQLPNLKSLFFGYGNLAGFDISINNNLNIKTNKNENLTEDLNTTTNTYVKNAYLSNGTQVNVVEETPSISLNKSFSKSLANRFHKSLNIDVSARQLLIFQDNKSDRSFQNIKRSYSQFAPDVNINYNNNQYGDYYRYTSLRFNTTISIPNLQQLAPLIDSTNVYYIQKGNLNLKEAVERKINFDFSHNDQTSKNTLNYNLNLSAGLTENGIADSIFIDNQNRRTIFLINANGNKNLSGYGNLKKTFKFKTTELQIGLNGGVNLSKNPGYLNGIFNFSNTFNTNGKLNFNFTYKDKFATEAAQSFNTYSSKQKAFNTEYSGINMASSLSSSYNVTKKFTVSSNITFNNSKSNNANGINYTIWNASVTYRFLKGNNAEFKLSALDLLHQNTNIINYGGVNSFTLGTQNVLQQYFITTFSYYPRKFGKNAPVKK